MLAGLLRFLSLGAVIYIGLALLLYWRQEAAIFFPVQNDPVLRQQFEPNRIELTSTDGVTLEGWSVDNPDATNTAVILYFGGNAEDVLFMTSRARTLNAQRFVAFNYRGYGGSGGRPGQEALYSDALTIHDHVIATGVRPEQIVVMGRSLGSAMAAMLAGSRDIGGAILVTPFDSLSAVAAGHYWFLPVRLLLRHPFPSIEWAQKARAPALFLAAGNDFIVPPVHARRLYEAWPAGKQFHLLAGVGHNDIELHPQFYPLINEFLARTPD